MACPAGKFIRWTKTGFNRSGRINAWLPNVTYSGAQYVYNKETNKFYRSVALDNKGNMPYKISDTWQRVEEDEFEDGLRRSYLDIELTGGDVAIRPLFFYCEDPGDMLLWNRHMDLNDRALVHDDLDDWSHTDVRETV